MRNVVRLSVTPVKSTALMHPDEVRLERYGVPGNRRFYFVDGQGKLLAAGRHGGLVVLRSEYEPGAERLTLRFPSGREVSGLVTVTDGTRVTEFWGRPVPGHVVGGPWAGAVSEHLGERVELVRADDPGGGNDSYAASMVSTASVRELARHAGEPVDARRFRMLVEFEGNGAPPHEEDGWLGRDGRLGEAVVRVIRPDPRCVVTTQNPESGQVDLDTLKALATYRRVVAGSKIPMGVYADVVEPGWVRVGDPVEPLTD